MNHQQQNTEHHIALQGWVSIGFVILGILIAPVRMAILTRSLTREDYGLFSLLSITAASLGFVGALGLRQFLIYILPGKSAEEKGRYVNSCTVVTLAAGSVLAILFIGAGQVIPGLKTSFSLTLLAIASVYILLYALANLGMGFLLAAGRVIRYRILNFMTSTLWLCIAIPVFLLGARTIDTLAWIWIVALFFTVLFIAQATRRELGTGIREKPVMRLMVSGIRYGVPLLPRYFALAMFRLADRFVILSALGAEQVAYYTVAATLVFFAAETSNFLDFMLPHISTAWYENIQAGQHGCTGKAARHFHTTLHLSLMTTLPLTAGLLLWGGGVVEWLAGTAYTGAHVVFPIMSPVVPVIALTNLIQFAITLDGRTIRVGNTILAASILNLFLNILLVHKWGIPGAAAATTFSYTLLLITTVAMSRLWSFIEWRRLKLIRIVTACLIMSACALTLRRFTNGFTLWEIPASGLILLLSGYTMHLWGPRELRSMLPNRKSLP